MASRRVCASDDGPAVTPNGKPRPLFREAGVFFCPKAGRATAPPCPFPRQNLEPPVPPTVRGRLGSPDTRPDRREAGKVGARTPARVRLRAQTPTPIPFA